MMLMRTTIGVAVAVAACMLASRASLDAGRHKSLSVWSGVYTSAQADRGAALFTRDCASCHGADMHGGDQAPELSGPIFLANWTDRSIGELVAQVRKTMPKSSPGKLTLQEYVDVIASVLRANKFPAGQAELPSTTAALDEIQIDEAPGADAP